MSTKIDPPKAALDVLWEVFPVVDATSIEVNGIAGGPCCDDATEGEKHHCNRVRPFRTLGTRGQSQILREKRVNDIHLWSITQRTDENEEQKTNIEIEENLKNRFASALT